MKKILITLCIISLASPIVSNQNDIDYQKDTALKVAEAIGAGVGGTLGSPGLIITVPAVGVLAALMGANLSRAFDKNLTYLLLFPIYLGAAGGKKLTRPLAITWLASNYNLPRNVVNLSIQYGLTLTIYRDLLSAAQTHNKEKVVQFLTQEMYLFFGTYWQQGFQQMLTDFEQILKIKAAKDIPAAQKPTKIKASPFFQNYNRMQIKLFGLMLRTLLVVYQLYYQKELPTSGQNEMRFDDYLTFKHNWIEPIQKIFNDLLKSSV